MIEKRKELPPKQDIPALNADENIRFGYKNDRKKALRRWYKIYLSTTLSVVCLAVIFLAVRAVENGSFNFEEIASVFLSRDFMDLSGDSLKENTDTKDESPDTSKPSDEIFIPSDDPEHPESAVIPEADTPSSSLYDFDYSKLPEGETAIIPMDLSLSSEKSTYIYNSTGYSPDTAALLAASLKSSANPIYVSSKDAPVVLIIHTHGTEAYSKEGAISYLDDGSEIARSENTSKNVVALGKLMAEILNENGISTLHCTIMHDQIQYKDAYNRAESTIKQYLKKYPSIKLVIDLHRDAVIKSTGELVRPVTLVDSEPTAQVMCVVGSDWGGEEYPNWQTNLSLSLKLRHTLNSKYGSLCRPTYLRSSTYNQNLAPYSLLLEIGACGNSLPEAQRAAAVVAKELIPIIKTM